MNIENLCLERIPISAPPILCEVLGYRGEARFVAFYWTPFGDDAICTDGNVRTDGNWYAWLLFVHHSAVAPRLEPYDFGSSGSEPTHWRLVDRQTNEIYAGTPNDIGEMLAQQSAGQKLSVKITESASSGVTTMDNFGAFLKVGLTEVEPPSQDEIKTEMRRRNELIDRLIRRLNHQEIRPTN